MTHPLSYWIIHKPDGSHAMASGVGSPSSQQRFIKGYLSYRTDGASWDELMKQGYSIREHPDAAKFAVSTEKLGHRMSLPYQDSSS